MKNIKAIFIDLDGTLVGHEGKVSSEAVEKIQKLINSGIKVVIATGRNLVQAKIITKDIDGLWYLTNNGAFVTDEKGKEIYSKALTKEELVKIVANIVEFKELSFFVQNQNRIVTNSSFGSKIKFFFGKGLWKKISIKKIQDFFNKEANLGHIVKRIKNPVDFFENTTENWLKILVFGNEKNIKILKEKFTSDFSISTSGYGNIEINAKGVSKGEAIKNFCKLHNINLEDTLCFGDSGNDIEMFKVVGIPVVMRNSQVEELKTLSKYEAKNCEDNGVYEFLEEHF